MRTALLIPVFAALAGTAGCSWSSFDDLGGETWVDSVGGADGVEPHDFLGIATPGTTTENSTFVALGRSSDSVGSYRYDKDGIRATDGTEIRAGTIQFSPLPPEAPVAGDPYSNRIGVAAVTGDGGTGDTKIASFNADDLKTDIVQNDFNGGGGGVLDGPTQPTGMVFARTDDDTTNLTATDIVLARGAQIAMVTSYDDVNAQSLAACFGATSNDVVLSVARGEFEGDAGDDELVAVINDLNGTAPQIVIFNGRAITTTWNNDMTAVNPCFDDGDVSGDRKPIARISGHSGDPDWGHRVVVGDFDNDGDADLAVSSPASETVSAYINDGLSPPSFTEVNVPALPEAGEFGSSMAAGNLDGMPGDELVVGAPQASFDGADHGGLAEVYTFDGAQFNKEFEVHDIQPETEQRMGASVAVVPWENGGRSVLVVGGDHEIFTYFQTKLYDDVRR